MSRIDHWRKALDAYVDAHRHKPFAWGTNDCWTFAGGLVEAITGDNVTKGYRGKHRTARGALGHMKRAGADTVADFVAQRLEEIHPINAQIGDLMAIPTDDAFGHSVGICNGERVLVLTQNGVDSWDRMTATRAFRVG
jgi:hypothetical protein